MHAGGSSVITVQVTAVDNSPTIVGAQGPNNVYSYHPVANCPPGFVATGGGVTEPFVVGITNLATTAGPTDGGNGWQAWATFASTSSAGHSLSVKAICTAGSTS